MQYPALGTTVYLRFSTEDANGDLAAVSTQGTPVLVVNGTAQAGSTPPITGSGGIYYVGVNTGNNGLLTSGSWAVGDLIRATITGIQVSGSGAYGGHITDEATIGPLPVNATQLGGSTQSATDLKDFADDGYDPATNKVQGVVLTDTATTLTNKTGFELAAAQRVKLDATQPDYVPATATALSALSSKIGTPLDLGTGANVGANLNDLYGVLTNTGVKVGTFVANAITAAAINTGAFTAAKFAADFWTTILSTLGLATGNLDDQFDDLQDAISLLGDSAGPGPYGVVVNVKSGATNLQSANVRATNGSETYRLTTDSSGNATYSLPADTWNFYVYKANYLQDAAPLTIVVTADDLTGNNITMTYDPPGQSLTEEDPTMTATFLTMYDVVCHLRDMLGGDDSEEKNRTFRRAARMAHDDFFSEDGWKESLVQHRVEVQDSYATGTIAFDLTGGSAERLVTLTDGTFPSWAGRGSIVIDSEHYRVVSRLSDTTVQLDDTLCPTADVAAGTSYTLYQDAYLLPADFGALYSPVDKNGWERHYVSEEDWLALTTESRIGNDYRYTIMHDDRVPGRYAIKFYGYPTEARTLTFLYKRKRKTPVLAGTETNSSVGTIAYTNGSATITGTSTVFSDAMIGSVLRIGDASNVPTDAVGDYPYLEEHVIAAVASATSLTLKTAVGLTSGSSKKYRISDPLSFDRGNQLALFKGAEAQYHELVNSSVDNVRDARMAYERAKVRCRDDQSKHRDHYSPVTGTTRTAGRPVINVNAP